MAKDAKGHGSEGHGGSGNLSDAARSALKPSVPTQPGSPFNRTRLSLSGGQPVASNEHAAATLASGPKSAPVATHDMMGRSQESLDKFSKRYPPDKPGQGYRRRYPEYEGPRYNRDAVNKAIASSNRSGRKIGGREASLIHRLLKGRQVGDQ
jgi:hypothetical protein